MTDTVQPHGRFLSFLAGLLVTLVCLVLLGYFYLRFGNPPVATGDKPFPFEKQIVHIALDARIQRDLETAPFPVDEAVEQSGAHIYVEQCAVCHGTPGHTVPIAQGMYPHPPQLWHEHGNGVVGVSDDAPGVTYWKVDNGIRLTGMPAFKQILSTEQMWQVSLLLKNADHPLSPAVRTILQSSATH